MKNNSNGRSSKRPRNRVQKGSLAAGRSSSGSKFSHRFENLETRTVLSGSAIVQPFSEVDYFGDRRDWAANAVNAPEVWAAGYTGEGVIVAVLDSGVDLNHSELVGNLWQNSDEIADNGIDDDGNGYVDDVHGWDFIAEDGMPSDESGHGTKVAGVISASRNKTGATGIAYDATLLPIRILDENGEGNQLDIANGIRYAVEAGADVINLSLGGTVASVNVQRAINFALENEVFIVSAAGNAADDMPHYPARYSDRFENVLSVGAYTNGFEIAGFSNSVGNSNSVQVDAPGVSIYSTGLGGGFRYGSGTSFAAPMVSGVAALMLSANPNLSAAELRQHLVDGANIDIAGSDSIGGIDASYIVASVALPPASALPQLLEGDVDGDGEVGFLDFLKISRNFGQDVQLGRADGDLNGDGSVGFVDFLVLSRNYGNEAAAIEGVVDEVFAELDGLG